MTPQEFETWRHDAVHALIDLNEKCEADFHLDRWPRWQYELEAATLEFLNDGLPGVIASIQVVGTSSKEKNEWTWSWANTGFPAPAVDRMNEVRQFGETEGIAELTRPTLPDDEHLGWEMSAVAARILGAKGAYRCPRQDGFLYLVYTAIGNAPQPDPERPEVQCVTHGRGFSTYLCEHLVAAPGQEWFCDEVTETNRWPDAWCAQCDAIYMEQGEWNETNAGRMNIKLLCHRCYESLRKQSA